MAHQRKDKTETRHSIMVSLSYIRAIVGTKGDDIFIAPIEELEAFEIALKRTTGCLSNIVRSLPRASLRKEV